MQMLKKMKEHDNVAITLLLVLLSLGNVLYNSVASGDEYLLLNNTLKMYNRKNDL